MSLVRQEHRYELRMARSRAYQIAAWVEAKLTDDFTDTLRYIPWELSVKESRRSESANGQEAETTFTFRFEGGIVVRLRMIGWDSGQSFGFLWKSHSAIVRFEAQQDPYGPPKPKKVLVLDEKWFRAGRIWLNLLPPTENEKIEAALQNAVLDGNEEELRESERLLRGATYIRITRFGYVTESCQPDKVELVEFTIGNDGIPEAVLQIALSDQQWERIADSYEK